MNISVTIITDSSCNFHISIFSQYNNSRLIRNRGHYVAADKVNLFLVTCSKNKFDTTTYTLYSSVNNIDPVYRCIN